jgi:hypothetical protein
MLDPHLQDGQVKKKKRLVLIGLLALLLGTAAASSLVGVTGAPSAAILEPTPELPTRTAMPIDTPVSTDTPVPPTREPTRTDAPTDTPGPTATSTPIPIPPTATEALPGGAGGGEPELSPTPTGASTSAPTMAPTETSTTPSDTPMAPTPTPEEPGELPVTGVDADGVGRPALGLTALSIGVLMLVIGFTMRGEKTSAASPHLTPSSDKLRTGSTEREEPGGALPRIGTHSGTRVRLALVVAAAVLVLALIAGYTLHKTRKQ